MGIHNLQDSVGRLSLEVMAPAVTHAWPAVTLVEAQSTSGCSVWDHPHVLWP